MNSIEVGVKIEFFSLIRVWGLQYIFLLALLLNAQECYSEKDARDSFRDALSAFNAGRVEFALSHWATLAANGHLEAAFHLGSAYYFGDGIPTDYSLALKWFRKAAESGHSASQFMLGLMHAEGHGVNKDLEVTVDWFDKAVGK
ncbi:MAG: tetratricopeptide repeat protein [Pseudomonadota bacterium]|nr:tetratricopeptide repeat protein [Pseudomonadota bacterium]